MLLISVDVIKKIDVFENNDVYGVTKLQNRIYVLCHKREIFVFEDRNEFCSKNEIKIEEIKEPGNIGSSEKEICLYVSEPKEKRIWKIIPEADEQYTLIKWLTTDHEPSNFSVSGDGRLLVVSQLSSILMIYGPEAELISFIQLPTDMQAPRQVVETLTGHFIILHKWFDEWRSGERMWVVSELARDGEMVIRRFIPSNKKQMLRNPYNISIDSEDRVFVTDSGKDRVVLLDFYFKVSRIICKTKEDAEDEEAKESSASIQVFKPWPLHYDTENNQLIVGGNFNLRCALDIYSLNRL